MLGSHLPMHRSFNTAGPCDSEIHYMVPPLSRTGPIRELIDRQSYFVVHAPRQAGKTTTMLELARVLRDEGRYTAALVSMVAGSPFHDVDTAERVILDTWRLTLRSDLSADLMPPAWPSTAPGSRIAAALQGWAEVSPKPLVLFLDEIDSLKDEALLSVLRQLHQNYRLRPQAFPWSVGLIGMRDVRDYKVTGNEQNRMGSASPFNIKDRSLLLRNFDEGEVRALYAQHTSETGQVFEPGVIERVYELTQGQPWLVNALAQEMVTQLVPDPSKPVVLHHVDMAKENVVQRRSTHFDSLAERLREERVRKVIAPIIDGRMLPDMPEDDFLYAIDLGLVQNIRGAGLQVANPIYAEVIPRLLVRRMDASLGTIRPPWLTPDGKLDADKLLEAFLAFWRRHGAALIGAAPYHEIAPHLVMMAFLDRVENGKGKVHREFAIGSGRLDMMLEYGDVRVPMELKVWRPDEPDPLKEGLEQIDEYLDGVGLDTGWLVIFDRRPNENAKKIARKVASKTRRTPAGRKVAVIRA